VTRRMGKKESDERQWWKIMKINVHNADDACRQDMPECADVIKFALAAKMSSELECIPVYFCFLIIWFLYYGLHFGIFLARIPFS
jgi:hypothetical protein